MGNSQDCFSCLEPPNLIITVKTGDTKGAALHNCAFLKLIDGDGKESQEFCLSGCCITVFKKGHTDVFTFNTNLALGPIQKVKISRRELHDAKCVDWFIEKIQIRRYFGDISKGEEKREDLIFPCHRWIRNKRPVILREYDSILPQLDNETEQRETELFWKRTMYRYHRRAPGNPPQTSFFPKEEVFSTNHRWDIMVKKQALRHKYRLPSYGDHPWTSFYEFDDIFGKKISTPAGRQMWRDDAHFGQQRLSGCDPTLITLCKAIPENLTVTSAMVEPFLDGLTLEEATNQNRVFMVDLRVLDKLQLQNDNKVCSPMALFFLTDKKKLLPVALQLFQQKSNENPVFLPSDPWYTWTLAKMWYNNAEAQYHRACSLIGFTHMVIESVAITTHRQLSPSHPLFRLLAPFIRNVIAINSFEVNELLAPGSWIDKVTTLGVKGTEDLIAFSFQEWRLDVQGCLPKDLENRGVSDPDVLPEYSYRDDALLLYQAIERYVTSVVNIHYESANHVIGDFELKEWARELASDDDKSGCGIKGIPGDGNISTIEELISVLTSILFISTGGHAGTNTPQYEEYGYIPNYPAVLLGEPPRDKSWREERALLECLPSKKVCLDIMLITKLLAERRRFGLSSLRLHYQYIPEEIKAADRFVDELKGISHAIQDHNRKRDAVYDYLNPYYQQI